MSFSAADFLAKGDLAGWIDAATAVVKKKPADVETRFSLAQALMIAGAIERADNQFDVVMTQDPTWAPKIALLRQMLRGLKSRQECFGAGRAPDVLRAPEPYLALLLRANAAHRAGDAAEAADLFEEAEAIRPVTAGDVDGTAFDDLRDLDDRTAGILELVTGNGKYYWVPWSDVREIIFEPATGPRDLFLRQVQIDIAEGPNGVVFLPTIYWTQESSMTDAMRLGRMSDWTDVERPPSVGSGRRCIVIGDDMHALGEAMTRIAFSAHN